MKEKMFMIISKVLSVPIEQIHEDSSPDTLDSWDSLQQVKIVLALEEEFGVQFTDAQIINLMSVKLILDALNKLV